MTNSHLAQLRQAVLLFGNVTPAAQVASELLAEVDRLRLLVPPEISEPLSIETVASAMNVCPRTVRMWVDRGLFHITADSRIDLATLLDFLSSQGWEADRLSALKERLTPPPRPGD